MPCSRRTPWAGQGEGPEATTERENGSDSVFPNHGKRYFSGDFRNRLWMMICVWTES
jgi:hypothetical protein